MKQIFLSLAILVASITAFAQCDKKNLVTCNKTEYLDANGDVQRSTDEITIIEFDNKNISVTPGDDGTATGTITSMTCDWKVPYKEGKTVMKADITDPQGQVHKVTLTIEGKDGKLTFLVDMEERADRRIRAVVNKFEEKK